MNPNDGSMHRDVSELRDVYLKSGEKELLEKVELPESKLIKETAEDKLVRAATEAEEALLRCPELPPEWPRFMLGERVHLKGHTFCIDRIERDAIVLKLAPRKEKKDA